MSVAILTKLNRIIQNDVTFTEIDRYYVMTLIEKATLYTDCPSDIISLADIGLFPWDVNADTLFEMHKHSICILLDLNPITPTYYLLGVKN